MGEAHGQKAMGPSHVVTSATKALQSTPASVSASRMRQFSCSWVVGSVVCPNRMQASGNVPTPCAAAESHEHTRVCAPASGAPFSVAVQLEKVPASPTSHVKSAVHAPCETPWLNSQENASLVAEPCTSLPDPELAAPPESGWAVDVAGPSGAPPQAQQNKVKTAANRLFVLMSSAPKKKYEVSLRQVQGASP